MLSNKNVSHTNSKITLWCINFKTVVQLCNCVIFDRVVMMKVWMTCSFSPCEQRQTSHWAAETCHCFMWWESCSSSGCLAATLLFTNIVSILFWHVSLLSRFDACRTFSSSTRACSRENNKSTFIIVGKNPQINKFHCSYFLFIFGKFHF